MLTMRESVGSLLTAAALTGLASALGAQQPEPYPATLYFGTGLINIPVAWVSPRSSDVWVNTSAKNLPSIPNSSSMTWMTRMNSNIAIDTHWAGRVSVGASAYSQNPDGGFFAQGLVLRQGDLGAYVPSLAVGLRNIGTRKHEDRFFIGEDITLVSTTSGYTHVVPDRYKNFNTAQTFYAVATEQLPLSSAAGGPGLSLTAGWGNGLFRDDGGLGASYNRRGTWGGFFAGLRYVMHPSLNSTLSVMTEEDSWDWNAGVVFDWRGLTAGVYGTELEEGTKRSASSFYVYNYAKYNLSLGYSGNIVDISHGVILRTRITELTREQQRLKYEIAERNRRIRGLEVALTKAQSSEVATLENRKTDLERQVQEEREQIRKAEERLRQLEQNQTRPAPTPAKPPTF
jgi:hypothetical protein